MTAGFLLDPGLGEWRIAHGFGVRGTPEPSGLVRPRQIHGVAVARIARGGRPSPEEADAIVARAPAPPVGVVTADCLPILLCAEGGSAVAAVHAGWRGLAAGVVAAGVAALRAEAPGALLRAALGPHIGACCYEVDAPVLARLAERFGVQLEAALVPSRPGHHRLELAALARVDLLRAGLADEAISVQAAACTRCDPQRFHSYRRDGAAAGRLVSFIACRVDTRPGAA